MKDARDERELVLVVRSRMPPEQVLVGFDGGTVVAGRVVPPGLTIGVLDGALEILGRARLFVVAFSHAPVLFDDFLGVDEHGIVRVDGTHVAKGLLVLVQGADGPQKGGLADGLGVGAVETLVGGRAVLLALVAAALVEPLDGSQQSISRLVGGCGEARGMVVVLSIRERRRGGDEADVPHAPEQVGRTNVRSASGEVGKDAPGRAR
mmetsp:Transcript_23310/g.68878  ORF Transcript_23310/g.68878 Transcript_23310/m.68878 type:complete len:207 (+) Transcript_23310:916-1536(+)